MSGSFHAERMQRLALTVRVSCLPAVLKAVSGTGAVRCCYHHRGAVSVGTHPVHMCTPCLHVRRLQRIQTLRIIRC
eukprot:1948492-Rhodomonas_salina.2